jgi:hypothetical protein
VSRGISAGAISLLIPSQIADFAVIEDVIDRVKKRPSCQGDRERHFILERCKFRVSEEFYAGEDAM